ncbi:uncharacterized protein Z518_06841 [Rhinocladiella mackenziei CBS 650.93]|uniref:Rhinocladiella mackenziei CBS 650.93 unplaced genomic scaffold supercont1.5, whole genome shotgun sequence n=1 Tax=Rhinocladiella mackenziei CBS 650.93 TaxID=1442369 RepID=A0A0D2IBU7_9EURO|nr:uncharacterized protein Z518_06841 [Rhinocladiella mackenziei CBS 650.93]KIX03289.1 hypothetical protein Z518_06841 [Rhinocladiella mackenziei CBS 650.93]
MAPTISPRSASGEHIRTVISRSVSSNLTPLPSRSTTSTKAPIASLFAVILRGTIGVSKRALQESLFTPRSPVSEAVQPIYVHPSALSKRQNAVLAIPTTYAGLNDGPAPGAVVGIVLGSIAGFILVLYILLSAFRLSGYWVRDSYEEEVVRHHHHRRSPRRSRSHSRVMTEVSSPRRERIVREHEETVVVEEHPSSVVEEEDIVEVIEEHSPERRPKRGPSGRSGFRTVDPAEFGGGGRPIRKVSRR